MSLNDIFITPDTPLRRAIEVLNEQHKRIVLITDSFSKLLGVLTDSDIRRIIIGSGSLDVPVSTVMITKPLTVTSDIPDNTILHLMKQKQIHQIPVLDDTGRVLDLKLIDDLLFSGIQAEAFIFAGGLGTRLYPITQEIPKPLVKVGGKEILFTIMDGLIDTGFQRITLALNHKADMIRNAIASNKHYDGIVRFVQEENSLGTAGALSLLDSSELKLPLLAMNGDILSRVNYASLLNFHEAEKNIVTMTVRTENIQIPFGVVELEGNRITGISEKPEYKYFINAGIYILSPEAVRMVPPNTKIDMPQLITHLINQNVQVGSFPIHEYWIDIGRHSELKKADQDYGNYFS
ncbi:nucleotidyltransferase family protein [Leptospira sp. FAT2]|uniref:nucleotidyltransferase family protein n=1 Tax=Leptospira sanjuanensis TaxID=2879643 RepID=UPI001EE7E92F|nr:nucleotidyltransferase family protein [Leptospira sanjuanensis]MCG6167585.1 nucleotidyltransferase family protein [Leptospira sanjuanensis]MCG6193004.1 nucleotidyltransferase family protein [Leptospira sanjuanensis]